VCSLKISRREQSVGLDVDVLNRQSRNFQSSRSLEIFESRCAGSVVFIVGLKGRSVHGSLSLSFRSLSKATGSCRACGILCCYFRWEEFAW
jgi:hypothetical protein